MPLEKGTYWRLVCDGCGEGDGFTVEGFGYMVAESISEAHEIVRDCEGRVEGEQITCPNCILQAQEEAEYGSPEEEHHD